MKSVTKEAQRPLRVLVVDDQEDILELVGEYLKARGLEVLTAYDGHDALVIARSGRADVLLTDLRIPGMSGMDLIDEVVRLATPMAIVAMTGSPAVEDAVRAMKLGVHDYVLKPFRLRDVFEALMSAAARLEDARRTALREERLRLFETVLRISDPAELSRTYGLLASVALGECAATEVALWMQGPAGWEAVARGGSVSALRDMRPDELDQPSLDGEVVSVPIYLEGQRVGLVAVAGGVGRTRAHLESLSELTGALSLALSRSGWAAPVSRVPGL